MPLLGCHYQYNCSLKCVTVGTGLSDIASSSHGQGQINIKIQMLFLPGCSYLIIFYK